MKNKRAYFSQARNKGAIAILGGMGPQASAKMLEVMVSMASRRFGAKMDEDFPEIIVDSLPVPDIISNKEISGGAREMLVDRVEKLNNFGVFRFVIACNTAHIIIDDLQKVAGAPFISMIDEVCREVKRFQIKKIGLLATPATIDAGLYQKFLGRLNIDVVLPNGEEIETLEIIIRRIVAGQNSKFDIEELQRIGKSLKAKGAQGIILGCTELPLVFPKDFQLPVFDSIEILSGELLFRFYGGEK